MTFVIGKPFNWHILEKASPIKGRVTHYPWGIGPRQLIDMMILSPKNPSFFGV
jgi:hypothetical protein